MDLFLVQKINKWAKKHGVGFKDALLGMAKEAVDTLPPDSSARRKRGKKILAAR